MKKHVLIITGLILVVVLSAVFIDKFFPDAMLLREPTREEKQEAFIRKYGKPLSVTLELGILSNARDYPGGPEIKLTEEQTRQAELIFRDAIEKADRIEVAHHRWNKKQPDGTETYEPRTEVFDVSDPVFQKKLANSFFLFGNTRFSSPGVFGDPPPLKLTFILPKSYWTFTIPKRKAVASISAVKVFIKNY